MGSVVCSSPDFCFSGLSSFSSVDFACFIVSLICLAAGGPVSVSLPVWDECMGFGCLVGFLHTWGSHL